MQWFRGNSITLVAVFSVLQINNIQKSYGSVRALNDVSLEVPEGSVYGILGPNGSGKTTLLGILMSVLRPQKGNFKWFDGQFGDSYRKKIGCMLETPNFYQYLSGEENLRITVSISGRGDETDITRVLKLVGLYERRKHRFSTYSLGMKQRLAIGAALLGNPGVLVLDEPTNGLDPVGIAEIRELIRALSQAGHSIIIASHLLDEVEKICTHVAILKRGNLLADGPVSEVLMDEDVVEMDAANRQLLTAVLSDRGITTDTNKESGLVNTYFPKGLANLEYLNRTCMESGIILTHLSLRRKKLETRFLELTND
ncbi:MAG: ATP-binding cassette domain-containing protein [Bacteroidetes bacterium]|nr:ATP-binding cassette domain-containing protein [Bacteroidota bacterium]